MAEDPISRKEFTSSMKEVYDKMSSIKESSIRVEASVGSMKNITEHAGEKIDKLYEVMFGNGKGDGIIAKLKVMSTQLKYHWLLIGIVLTGLVTGGFHIIGALLREGGK